MLKTTHQAVIKVNDFWINKKRLKKCAEMCEKTIKVCEKSVKKCIAMCAILPFSIQLLAIALYESNQCGGLIL